MTRKTDFNFNTQNIVQSNTLIFTNASRNKNEVRIGIYRYIPNLDYNHCSKLDHNINVIIIRSAEIVAINKACVNIVQKNIEHSVILSDSKSTIKNINKKGLNLLAEDTLQVLLE